MKKIIPIAFFLCIGFFSFAEDTSVIEIEIDEPTENEVIAPSETESEVELQVVASRVAKRTSDTSADVTVISAKELEAHSGGEVTELLREYGIVAYDGTSSRKNADEIYIRGLASDRILIVVDGQRVRDGGTMGGISALQRIPISSIERIEIIKGPSSFLWGSDAQAGVIYIETKKGSEEPGFSGSIGTSYGNNFRFEDDNHNIKSYVNGSYGWNETDSVWLGASVDYGYPWASLYSIDYILGEPYKVKSKRDEFINFDVYGGTKFDFADIHSLELTLKYQQENSPLQEGSVEDNKFQKALLSVDYTLYPLDNLDINISSGVNYDAESRMVHSVAAEDYYIFSNSEVLLVGYVNDIFTLKGGYNFDMEFFEEEHVGKLYNQQNHAFFFGGDADIDTKSVDIDVTAGVRYQLHLRGASGFTDASPLHSVSPEVGIVIKPWDFLGFKLHAGHSFKTPDLIIAFRDYFFHTFMYIGPNPNLKPETGWGYSGSVEYSPLENLTFSVGAFGNNLENLIDYELTDEIYNGLQVFSPVNIAKAYTWGFDFSTRGNFAIPVFGSLNYNGNFEYLFARQVLDSKDQYVDIDTLERFNPRLDRPEFTVSGSLSWDKKEWGTGVKVSGFYFAQGYKYEEVVEDSNIYEEKRTSSYSSVDLRLSQSFDPYIEKDDFGADVYFEIKNLFNFVYDNDGDGDTDRPERQFVIGFSMTF